MVSVVLADDHRLVRQGIKALLERYPGLAVVAAADDGSEALELVRRLVPDVLLTDLAMPGLNGLELTRQVRDLGLPTKVIVLSMYASAPQVRAALVNGARGFIPKDSVSEELFQAINAVSQGATYLGNALSGAVLKDVLTPTSAGQQGGSARSLSAREREVLQLIADGHTNKSIARVLNISVKTIERHRANLMETLDVHNAAELVQVAIKGGLVFVGK